MAKPVVVQHSFGVPGSGGPITALERLLASDLANRYTFLPMHQEKSVGGINAALISRWVRYLRQVRPDLVHVRGLGNEGFHGAMAARLAGCSRVLVSIHGTVRDLNSQGHPLRRRALVDIFEPATLRLASHITTVCHSAARRTFLDPYRQKLLDPIANGVSLTPATPGRVAARAKLGLSEESVVMINVGRLSTEKGHLILADALRRLPPSDFPWVLLVVGDGPDRAIIGKGYRGLPNVEVRMMGQQLDVLKLLAAADLFVFPTLHENLSNALLEAMACGLPVVATRVGGNVEVLERGGGLLVSPASAAELAEAIDRLGRDKRLRWGYGSEAHTVIDGQYSLRHMESQVDRTYQRILAGTP